MRDYIRIQTSPEVWAVIRARHGNELRVFSSYSAPAGDPNGDPTQGRMCTAYGFDSGDFPVIEARTTWDIELDENGESKPTRKNEKHEYWLCAPIKD